MMLYHYRTIELSSEGASEGLPTESGGGSEMVLASVLAELRKLGTGYKWHALCLASYQVVFFKTVFATCGTMKVCRLYKCQTLGQASLYMR